MQITHLLPYAKYEHQQSINYFMYYPFNNQRDVLSPSANVNVLVGALAKKTNDMLLIQSKNAVSRECH
jgi:hypothetical protein